MIIYFPNVNFAKISFKRPVVYNIMEIVFFLKLIYIYSYPALPQSRNLQISMSLPKKDARSRSVPCGSIISTLPLFESMV